MTLNRRQALQLAAFGLLQGPALAQGQGIPHRYFGGFENDPTGEKHDTTRWAKLPILGVLCTVTWKQSPTDKWTWFRGLKQGYAVGKNVLLKDEWEDLWLVGGRRLFGKLSGDRKTVWEIPLARKGKDLKLGKPVATTYTDLWLGGTLAGVRNPRTVQLASEYDGSLQPNTVADIDWLDSDGEVITTLHSVLRPPDSYYQCYTIEFLDPGNRKVRGFLDKQGQLLSPLLPEARSFVYVEGNRETFWYAVPVNEQKTRFFPITQQGQIPTDVLNVRGYYPNITFPAPGTPETAFSPVIVGGWLKEYELESGLAYGWVSKNLKQETGPMWRSMQRLPAPKVECLLAELLDGSWMVYRLAHYTLRDAGQPAHEPLLPEPAPSRAEALRRLEPVYQEKIVKPQEEARQRELEQARRYWEQRSKDNITLLIAHGYKPGQATETPAELQGIAEALRSIRTAIELRQYNDYQQALARLPTDWQIRYIISGGQSAFGEHYSITADVVEGYAKSARDPQLAAELRQRTVSLRAQEEARKKQAELDATAFKKRQEEWKQQGNPNGPAKPSGHVYTAPPSASWVYKSQPSTPTSSGLGQYMKDLYEYGRGRDWKPVYR
ncbi:hypothetical protein [Armatimonas sp.]|uniref:hypothetical protein n=1 Tax=Armatimonas sp. TaxID=1872638 RepID=UPI00286B49C9|nr:hypothetical protein [Armatimonas sp.]